MKSFRKQIIPRIMLPFGYYIFIIISISFGGCYGRGGDPSFDPFSTLGITSSTATQEVIDRQYKKLCLKYHPDKNLQKSQKEQKRCEESFKDVQKAMDMIGTEEARNKYRSQQYQQRMSSSSRQRRGYTKSAEEELYELYREMQRRQQQGRRRSSSFFRRQPPWYDMMSGLYQSHKSIYIERVAIPLEDLYTGGFGTKLIIQDNIWKRYQAAFRGGIGKDIFSKAFGIFIGMSGLFHNMPMSLLASSIFFHRVIPRPRRKVYKTNLKSGWKTGTKLTFRGSEGGLFDIIFILIEKRHKSYVRVDNDLYYRNPIVITEKQRKNGCTIPIRTLSGGELNLTLRPNQIQLKKERKSLTRLKIGGKGWPISNNKNGDLIVFIKVRG